eukprot:5111785-Pyramimonas_sp.AAC.1
MPQNSFYPAWMPIKMPRFSTNIWPQHWSAERKMDADKYYLSMPEEFYTQSSLPVVTPTNALQWLQQVLPRTEVNERHRGLDFQGYCSGSSRLSLAALHLRLQT